ncbi:MAG: hypothetical protein WA902_01625 [Thermosynechococcaceae cyanobacterium]
MTLHPEFKRSTLQFWRQMEMFHVFLGCPELGVKVSYDLKPVQKIFFLSEHCAVEVPDLPTITYRATIIDTLSIESVEAIISRFSFNADQQSYVATLGMT